MFSVKENHQQYKTIPQPFIKESRVHLDISHTLSAHVQIHEMIHQSRLFNLPQSPGLLKISERYLHSQQAVGIPAKRFPVEEITPASHNLSYKQRHSHGIEHQQRLLFSHFRKNKQYDNGCRHTADDAESAVPGIDNIRQMIFIIVPGKNHVISSRTNNCRNHHADQIIQIQLRILPGPLRLSLSHQQTHQKTGSDDDTIKHNRKISDGNVPSHMGKYNTQIRKSDIHIFHNNLV